MMWRILPVELGVNWNRNLEGQAVRRGQSIAEDYSGDEPTLYPFAILDGNVAPLDEGLLLDISLVICRRAASEQRYEGSDVEGTVETITKLATALKLIAGEELVCSEPNAGIGRLGRVESGKNKGVLSRLEGDVVTELVQADEGVAKCGDALFAESEIEKRHDSMSDDIIGNTLKRTNAICRRFFEIGRAHV